MLYIGRWLANLSVMSHNQHSTQIVTYPSRNTDIFGPRLPQPTYSPSCSKSASFASTAR